eukprot:5690844-Prymnesium_polylepis.1
MGCGRARLRSGDAHPTVVADERVGAEAGENGLLRMLVASEADALQDGDQLTRIGADGGLEGRPGVVFWRLEETAEGGAWANTTCRRSSTALLLCVAIA